MEMLKGKPIFIIYIIVCLSNRCGAGLQQPYKSSKVQEFFGSQSGSSHERAIFEHGALRKVRVNFKCSLHH